jgi:hypothetical protein
MPAKPFDTVSVFVPGLSLPNRSALLIQFQAVPPGDPDELRAELGIPLDTQFFFLCVDRIPHSEAYSFELVGVRDTPERLTAPEAPRFFLRVASDPEPLTLIAWRRRVYCRHTPLYLEALWRPPRSETVSIHGLERLSPPSSTAYSHAYKCMVDAHKLLHKLEGRGRPRGPRGFRDQAEFLDTLADIIRAVEANGMQSTQSRVATFLRAEIDKRLRDVGSGTNAEDRLDSTIRLIRTHIPCPWTEFVQHARAAHTK